MTVSIKAVAQDVAASVKNVGKNAKIVLGGREKYVNNYLKPAPLVKNTPEAISKAINAANENFGVAQKQLKTAGIAGAVAAAVAVIAGVVVAKAVKNHKAQVENGQNNQAQGVDTNA